MIDTIVFDIGNVMVDFCWQKAIDNMKLPSAMADRLAKATVLDKMWDEFDKGVLSEAEILAGFVRNAPEIEDVINDFFYNHYCEIIEKYDYANDWVQEFKESGYRVYFLSNFSEKGFRELASSLDFVELGDGAVISYKEKCIKPANEIYQILMDRYNVIPENAVFLDDSLKNVEAAKKLGFNAICFESREQGIRELSKLGVTTK